MKKILKLAAAALASAAIAGSASGDQPEVTIAVDNLWPTMDPVIGISTTGARVHSNIFDTLVRRKPLGGSGRHYSGALVGRKLGTHNPEHLDNQVEGKV